MGLGLERTRDAVKALGVANNGIVNEDKAALVRKLIAKSIARENQTPDNCFDHKKAELEFRAELYRLDEQLAREANTGASARAKDQLGKLKSPDQIQVIFEVVGPYPLAEACLEVIPADQRVSLFRGRYCHWCGEVDHRGNCTCMRDD
jgi:hypothetical protein